MRSESLERYLHSSATISTDQRYRYTLARSWSGDFGAYALWLGLNPSTADGDVNDPTVDNVCRRTQYWKIAPNGKAFVGAWLGNLYAWRATDPVQLLQVDDPVGPNNDSYLRDMLGRCDMVICAWGNGPFPVRQQPMHMRRCREVLQLVADAGHTPYMLHRCASGHPRHPLYWPEDAPAHLFPGYNTNKEKNDDKGRGIRTTEEASR
jgi:hypothetical protein